MIDTIKFEILIPSDGINAVKKFLQTYCRIENDTGEVLSAFTRGSLLGSWDSRISVVIKDQRFRVADHQLDPYIISQRKLFGPNKIHKFIHIEKKVIAYNTPEYLVVEFSLPKWATGINFTNSTFEEDALRLSVFRRWLSGKIKFELPPLTEWVVHRVDIGQNYFIGSDDLVVRHLDCFKNLTYPRRKPIIYESSVYFAGKTTTLKLYSKGPEFKAHDKKRFKKFDNSGLAEQLEYLATGILRYEIEFKAPKLDLLGVVFVTDIFKFNGWGDLMKTELKRLMAGATTTKVYTVNEVREKLQDGYITGQGVSPEVCLSVWLTVALSGKAKAKESFGQRKTDRALKVLELLDIACITNIHESEPPQVPEFDFCDFSSKAYDILIQGEVERLLPFDFGPLDDYDCLPSLPFRDGQKSLPWPLPQSGFHQKS